MLPEDGEGVLKFDESSQAWLGSKLPASQSASLRHCIPSVQKFRPASTYLAPFPLWLEGSLWLQRKKKVLSWCQRDLFVTCSWENGSENCRNQWRTQHLSLLLPHKTVGHSGSHSGPWALLYDGKGDAPTNIFLSEGYLKNLLFSSCIKVIPKSDRLNSVAERENYGVFQWSLNFLLKRGVG